MAGTLGLSAPSPCFLESGADDDDDEDDAGLVLRGGLVDRPSLIGGFVGEPIEPELCSPGCAGNLRAPSRRFLTAMPPRRAWMNGRGR